MENITNNPYFDKIILTLIAVMIKLFFGFIFKTEKKYQGILTIAYYILPLTIVVWLNLDENVENSKLTTTIICLNIAFIIFNFLQQKIMETDKLIEENDKLIEQLAKTEYNKVEKINQINAVQSEKMKAINNNQKYILGELSRINDRIIGYFKDKTV